MNCSTSRPPTLIDNYNYYICSDSISFIYCTSLVFIFMALTLSLSSLVILGHRQLLCFPNFLNTTIVCLFVTFLVETKSSFERRKRKNVSYVWFVFIFYIDSYDELLKLMITKLEMKGKHKRTKIDEGYL